MTIRDSLRRRFKRLALFVGVCCVGITAGLVHWPPVIWLLTLFLLPVVAVTSIIVGMRFIKCPRCGVRLGETARAAAKERPTAINCPHCGVNLDEPMDDLVRTD